MAGVIPMLLQLKCGHSGPGKPSVDTFPIEIGESVVITGLLGLEPGIDGFLIAPSRYMNLICP